MKKKKINLEDLILDMLERHPDSWFPTVALMGAFKLPKKKGGQRFQQAIEKLQQKDRILEKDGKIKLKEGKGNGKFL